MRKAAIVVTAILAGLLLLAIGLPRIVSLDGMRPRIAAALEARTGRKATLSGLSLSLFPGIGVKVRDLSLSGDPGHETGKLIDVPEAEIRMAILPLLAGRVEFTRIILDRPSILIRKYADGTTSFTD
ncbi:MAG TPA: AsmA family protein, partial [Candidatus Deferrimicrobiaceae bacterium]